MFYVLYCQNNLSRKSFFVHKKILTYPNARGSWGDVSPILLFFESPLLFTLTI